MPYPTSVDTDNLRKSLMSLKSEEGSLLHAPDTTIYSATPFSDILNSTMRTEGSLSDFGSVEDVFDGIRGFFNATEFVYGGHRTNCYYRSENVVYSLILAENTLT